MKNLLGKFHAELSQQVSFFGFLSGKFHVFSQLKYMKNSQ